MEVEIIGGVSVHAEQPSRSIHRIFQQNQDLGKVFATGLLRQLGFYRSFHVRREFNEVADRLTNRGAPTMPQAEKRGLKWIKRSPPRERRRKVRTP